MPLPKSPYDTQLARELFVSDDAHILANAELKKWKKWRVDTVKELEKRFTEAMSGRRCITTHDKLEALIIEILESLKP